MIFVLFTVFEWFFFWFLCVYGGLVFYVSGLVFFDYWEGVNYVGPFITAEQGARAIRSFFVWLSVGVVYFDPVFVGLGGSVSGEAVGDWYNFDGGDLSLFQFSWFRWVGPMVLAGLLYAFLVALSNGRCAFSVSRVVGGAGGISRFAGECYIIVVLALCCGLGYNVVVLVFPMRVCLVLLT